MIRFIPQAKRTMSLSLAAFVAVVSHAQSSFWTNVGASRSDAPTVEVNEYETWQLQSSN